MGKDFLNLKTDQKKLYVGILCTGMVLTVVLGVGAFRETELQNGFELQKNEAGNGSYDQKLYAFIRDEKIPITVEVQEQRMSKAEAEQMLSQAEKELDNILKADNESLSKITTSLNFADGFAQIPVEIQWTEKAPEYFYSDGSFREDAEILEPVEKKVSAILSCQGYTKDYEAVITILPRKTGIEKKLSEQIAKEMEAYPENEVLRLPEEYEGNPVTWKKPMDMTFVYFGMLMAVAVVFLKIGSKRDEQVKKAERLESLEKDYAQIVSKFTMLLSAGLSVRNAWERIVLLYKGKEKARSLIYTEMNWAMREMQKGVPELEVYERFGVRVGLIHYKKLMALFIMDKKRGSINLLEAMNQEMLQAWEEQKRKTKQQGEKAGTKLLIPMMGMLAVVFIMILVPAFLSFQL